MTAKETANFWLKQPIDNQTKEEIEKMMHDPNELEDAFYRNLEFGTGGMRGVMGVGSNRVNQYTLGMATQGLSNYLKSQFQNEEISVAIAFDCRNNSADFARLTASVLSANNIRVHLFSELRPTPQLSFAVRKLACKAGIVITASHNPPEYNGYKVYWNDGGQIVAPHDKGIIAEVEKISSLSEVNFNSKPELIQMLDNRMDTAFITASLNQRKAESQSSDLKIVFTSLHGTAITLMPELFQRAGYSNFEIVKDQATPDGNFPTVKSPNPEEREALSMALAQAESNGADVVIGTDPDADRVGVAIRDDRGELILLNGNQCGALITDYLLRKEKENGTLKQSDFIAYTIVSSELFGSIARHYNCHYEVCLTGFKHIANLIRVNEGKRRFIGGGEESYGFMIGDFVRDKDAFTPALIFCDLASNAKSRGSSVFEELTRLYDTHGFYFEHLVSITKKGKTGATEIAEMMSKYRQEKPRVLGGKTIVQLDDLEHSVSVNYLIGSSPIDLPKSNVLQFHCADGSKISARPSGTEPKIKFYFSLKSAWDKSLSYNEHAQQQMLNVELIMKDLGI